MKSKPKAPPPPAAPAELLYVIRPRTDGDAPRLEVELSFKAGRAAETALKLPSQWAGQQRLYEGIKNLRAVSPRASLADTHEPQFKLVRHPRGRRVTVSYEVHQDWTGDPVEQGRYFRPIIQKDYFHFIGEAVFVHPVCEVSEPRQITLNWKGLPAAWKLGNSFGTNRRTQVFRRPVAQFRHAVYVGGDFRIRRLVVHKTPVYVAMRGEWKFSDEDYFDLVKRVIKTERAFWNDFDFPYFLITLIPTGTRCCHYAGTGLTDSFATFISTDKPVDARLRHLLMHELFHTWNGRKIKRQAPEELVYWFSEGFTEYYTRLLLLRSGMMTIEEYVRNYNKVILDYYSSPCRSEKNKVILKNYWRIRAVRQLPYQRGDILAHNWNRLILAATGGRFSLDNVMLDLLAAARSEGVIVSASNINKLIRRYLPQGIRGQIKEYIDNGVLIPPHESALGPCAWLKTVDVRLFDLGFNYEASLSRGLITELREGSSAHRAGLRNGDQIMARTIFHGDTSKAVEIKVKAAGGEKQVRFLPLGDKIRVPQYVWDIQRFRENREESLSWFGLRR